MPRATLGRAAFAPACIFCLLLAAPLALLAADSDGDGIPDETDTTASPSGIRPPYNCDSDPDGYGNLCDADYDNDWGVGGPDFSGSLKGLTTMSAEWDLDCDGTTGGTDFGPWTRGFSLMKPGPSRLSCAGHVPCPPEPLAAAPELMGR